VARAKVGKTLENSFVTGGTHGINSMHQAALALTFSENY
jgi:hypothetical protein